MNVREAKAGDFEGILALCDGVFNDLDVFPYLLTRYISAPNRLVYVAEDKHGHIVACCAAVVLDNGKTYVGEGYRTAREYHGTGLQQKVLGRRIYLDLKKRFPAIRNFIRVASRATDFYSKRGKTLVNKPLFTQLLMIVNDPISPARLAHLTHSRNLDRLHAHLPLDRLQMVPQAQFKQVLNDKAACQHLFPHGFVYVHSEMYELVDENITDIFDGRGTAQGIGLPSHSRGRYDNHDQTACVHYDSLSFGLCLQAKKGWVFGISYFGRDVLDDVCAHIMKHLTLLSGLNGQDVYIGVSFHQDKVGESTVNGVTEFLRRTMNLKDVTCQKQFVLNRKNLYISSL